MKEKTRRSVSCEQQGRRFPVCLACKLSLVRIKSVARTRFYARYSAAFNRPRPPQFSRRDVNDSLPEVYGSHTRAWRGLPRRDVSTRQTDLDSYSSLGRERKNEASRTVARSSRLRTVALKKIDRRTGRWTATRVGRRGT